MRDRLRELRTTEDCRAVWLGLGTVVPALVNPAGVTTDVPPGHVLSTVVFSRFRSNTCRPM